MKDSDGQLVAVRYAGKAWVDAFGGIFDAVAISELDAFAKGETNELCGCTSPRLVVLK